MSRTCPQNAPRQITKSLTGVCKMESWKRPPRGTKATWRRQVAKGLEPHLKPYKHTKKKWEIEWMGLCEKTAANRKQWKVFARNVFMADKGQQCLQAS